MGGGGADLYFDNISELLPHGLFFPDMQFHLL